MKTPKTNSPPTLGNKHTCSHCNVKFYDMGQEPVTCPRCSNVRIILTKALERRSKRNAENAAKKAS